MKKTLLILVMLTFIKVSAQKSNSDLLQGKWQSTSDKSNFLIFENNHRKESGCNGSYDDYVFIISDTCMCDVSDYYSDITKETDRYISVVDEGLCWYIIDVTPTELTLSYVLRGNILSYKKVRNLVSIYK
tara:strand:+ start:147 stop:536 length:390 start_codon:yes stop_codon:yes gene_type:complete